MYHEKPPVDRKTLLLRLLAFLTAAVLVFGLLSALSGHIEKDLTEKGARVLKDTILQSAVQCYAVEGSYPPSLEYLEENYGLQINHKRYLVTYDIFASNLMPQMTVLQTQ